MMLLALAVLVTSLAYSEACHATSIALCEYNSKSESDLKSVEIDGGEFIELCTPTGMPQDLTGFCVVVWEYVQNTTGTKENKVTNHHLIPTSVYNLDGLSTNADGFFVIGDEEIFAIAGYSTPTPGPSSGWLDSGTGNGTWIPKEGVISVHYGGCDFNIGENYIDEDPNFFQKDLIDALPLKPSNDWPHYLPKFDSSWNKDSYGDADKKEDVYARCPVNTCVTDPVPDPDCDCTLPLAPSVCWEELGDKSIALSTPGRCNYNCADDPCP